jgi:DNA polymerase I-like protein with 3'-5' exonuclease and polymerase domains/uracil-DNA glycosylase
MTTLQVQGHGQNSKLFILGDYPSETDLKRGYAFEDSSGWNLTEWLNTHNVRFKELYRTHYYKNDMPSAWKKEKDKKKKEKVELPNLPVMHEVLTEELKALQPKVILTCGEMSLNYLTGAKGVDKQRGSLLPLLPDIQTKTGLHHSVVVPIIHPRDLNRQYRARIYTQLDIQRAVMYTQKRYVPPEALYSIWVCRTARDFRQYLNRGFHNCKFYTTDIETFLGHITAIGFCYDGREAISIPLTDFKIPLEERVELVELIDKVWRSDKDKVNQNIKYDQWVSEHWGYVYENVKDDTMLRTHSMYPELPKGLDFLTSIHTEIPYYKDEGKEFDPSKHSKDQLYLYNAKDCLATHLVYSSQLVDCKQLQVWPGYTVDDFHTERVIPLYDIYRHIDKAGIKVDDSKRQQLITKYSAMLNWVTDNISRAVGFDYNLNSPKQSCHIVYQLLGLPLIKKLNHQTGKQSLTTDEEALEEQIVNKIDYETTLNIDQRAEAKGICQLLLTARHLHGAIEWLRIAAHLDGRMRTSTKITGNKTGRTSAASTPDYAWGIAYKTGKYILDQINLGMSFQTTPKHGKRLPDGTKILDDLITIFVPNDGWVFIEGDKSQAEARVVCVLANDYEQLSYFDKPNDVHILTTSWVTDQPYEELLKKLAEEKKYAKLKQDPPTESKIMYNGVLALVGDIRQEIGKPTRHAGNYDMGAFRLSQMSHRPIIECTRILIKFHDKATKIREVFHKGVEDAIRETKTLVNPYGRMREAYDRITGKTLKELYAQLPQSTISDHVKFDILTPMMRKYEGKELECLNEKHDSLLFHCPKELRDDVAVDFIKFGNTPIDFSKGTFVRNTPIVIPTDINWSDTNWKEMKEWKI